MYLSNEMDMIMLYLHSSGKPQCVNNVSATSAGCGVINITWEVPTPPPVTDTVVHFGPLFSPNTTYYTTCKGSGCSIGLMTPNTTYQFEVFPDNWCGRASGCVGNVVNSTTGTCEWDHVHTYLLYVNMCV